MSNDLRECRTEDLVEYIKSLEQTISNVVAELKTRPENCSHPVLFHGCVDGKLVSTCKVCNKVV